MIRPIPLVDLKTQYRAISDEVEAAMREVMQLTAFVGGPAVQQFEQRFAAYCDTEHAVGVGSGTDARWLALLALGIKPGDEVITVPFTFIATAEAIHFCGATPVFVDIDQATYTMDPAKLAAAITPRTKAIVPVHLYGQPADMIPILEIAAQHGLYVIEDAAQAHGARYGGRRAGSLGDVGCFSCYPDKNLGAYGEAGIVVTNDSEVAARVASFREHGQLQRYDHTVVGWNARMDGLQAAVLNVKLPYLDEWNERRREHARQYDRLFDRLDGIVRPYVAPAAESVFHRYVLRAAGRDRIIQQLRDKGIHCGIHYPVPVHLQKAFEHLGHVRGDFPVAEKCADEVFSLPMYPELKPGQIEYVADQLRSIVSSDVYEAVLA